MYTLKLYRYVLDPQTVKRVSMLKLRYVKFNKELYCQQRVNDMILLKRLIRAFLDSYYGCVTINELNMSANNTYNFIEDMHHKGIFIYYHEGSKNAM